jgi:ribosomal protein S18 acetylase RimI-like enzyme
VPTTIAGFEIRPSNPDDAVPLAALYAARGARLAEAPCEPAAFERLIQTGSAFMVAIHEGRAAGAIRMREHEGIAWFDLLVSGATGAGPALLRAAEQAAQDRGIRLARMEVPEESRLPSAFSRFGYLPIARTASGAGPALVLEKRLPLLTVREQRRSDAAGIARLTGEDPWPFEQGTRPGWFVLADGERVAGAISVRIGRGGRATASPPSVDPAYRGRAIESWMLERAATYAETNGALTITVQGSPELDAQGRTLEDFRWESIDGRWEKRLGQQHYEE